MSVDDDVDALERRLEFDRQRIPIDEQAREAQGNGDLVRAAMLWQQSLELSQRFGADVSRWYVEGQLADVLLKSGQVAEAKQLLEASLRAGSDIPFAHRLLMGIYMEEGAFEDAYRVQHDAWMSVSERAQRNGMPPIDPSIQIVEFAKWWKDTGSEQPIRFAETWAEQAQTRGAWFAVRHERAQFLEKQSTDDAALELYLDLVRQGSTHDATYTRAMILLDRAKRSDEALALARAIPSLGLSASLEEQARKRIARIEAKVEKSKGRGSRVPKKPKALVPAFSIRSGEAALHWISQVEVKGGISTIVATAAGVYATGGTEPALWWIATGATEPRRLRSITKRARLYCSQGAALVTDEGTVKDGRAHVEILGKDWATVAAVDLPGVTSEVVTTTWGFALGCRAGGLYAVGFDGAIQWRFDLPERPEAVQACPYYVSSASVDGTVVFSSFAEVYALTAEGHVRWTWRLPAPQGAGIGGLIVINMAAFVSTVQATRDGGAWIASQDSGIFRVNGRGELTWSTKVGGNVSQLVLDHDDKLVAVGYSSGIALIGPTGTLTTVIESKRWPRVLRSEEGTSYLVTEGKLLSILDGTGQLRAVVEFSRPIADAVFSASHIVIAAGKLVAFDIEAPRV